MVNYKHILKKNWLHSKPVKPIQHWYQSLCSDSWMEPSKYDATNTPQKQPIQNSKRKISPEGKKLLREKVQEIVSYNSTKMQKESKNDGSYKRKDRRPKCYACRKRGHAVRNCPKKLDKQHNIQNTAETSTISSNMNPSYPTNHGKAKYQEQVHVLTDYMG